MRACDRKRGLGRLRGPVLCAGSEIRVGFQLAYSLTPYFLNDLSEAVEGCLYASGGFDSVIVQIQEGSFYVYVLVKGVTAVDFADKEDVGALVAGVINQCGGKQIGRRDPVQVDNPPSDGAARGCQGKAVTDAIPVTPTGQDKSIFDQILPKDLAGGNSLLVIGGIVALILVLKK